MLQPNSETDAPAPTTNADELDGTVFICDNLPFLKRLDDESIDLVCIDPPFGKRQTFVGRLEPALDDDEIRIEGEMMASWGVYDADTAYVKGLEYPDQEGQTAVFADIWSFRTRVYEDWLRELEVVCPGAFWLIKATRYTHSDSTAAYIAFMVERMLEVKRVLKPTGSVYLHCDHEANAYLRQMMDAIFGQRNFCNEIIWRRHNANNSATKRYGNVTDTILFYTKSNKWTWNRPSGERSVTQLARYKQDSNGRWYKTEGLHGRGTNMFEWRGTMPRTGWRYSYEELERLWAAGRILTTKDGRPRTDGHIQYLDELPDGVKMQNLWLDLPRLANTASERTGYPTQKPQALAERIITASTNPGDLVLDCFAGCAYVPVAAQLTGRRWIACDMSPRAWTIVRRQFHKHPQLGIVSEGELPQSETEPDVKLRPQLATANRVIKVRGPDQLPERRTEDVQPQTISRRLSEPQYRQKPVETSDQIWEAFVMEWGMGCWYCGRPTGGHRQELHLDHIEPNKRDGSNDDCWNRALACTVCNSNKSDKLTPEQTINRALEDGLIPKLSLHDEVLQGFRRRHKWARDRWELEVKPD